MVDHFFSNKEIILFYKLLFPEICFLVSSKSLSEISSILQSDFRYSSPS